MPSGPSRREFLGATTAGAAATCFAGHARAQGANARVAPNDSINMAGINISFTDTVAPVEPHCRKCATTDVSSHDYWVRVESFGYLFDGKDEGYIPAA